MNPFRLKLRARAQARYDAAIAQLKPAEDGSYDQDEVAAKIAAKLAVDIKAMQLRQAMQDIELLRSDLDDEDEAPAQLNLFGEGRLVDYDPSRLVLGPKNRIITQHRATLDYKVEERNRATLNRERAQYKEARKVREVQIFAKWSREQLRLGRYPLELTWGNCVRESGILREKQEHAA